MNDKEKKQLLALVVEFGAANLRGMDISAQLVLLEITRRVDAIPPPAETNSELRTENS